MLALLKLGVAGALALSTACGASGATSSADPASDEPTNGPDVSIDQAVVHGAADRGRHPAVLALLAEDPSGTALCTGALVAPDLVLTARHCVSYLRSEAVQCPTKSKQITGDRSPSSITVLRGDDVRTAQPIARGAEILAPKTDVLCANDIALLRLDRPIHDLAPMRVARGAPIAGHTITAVGYGLTSSGGTAGAKRFRSGISILRVGAAEFIVGEATCSGDSGGPAIDEHTGEILGVVSRGPQPCEGAGAGNVYTRADRVAGAIGEHVTPSAPDEPTPDAGSTVEPPADDRGGDQGDACTEGASCATGLCVRTASGGYCSRKCGGDAGRCPAGYHCTKTGADAGEGGVCAKVT
jgi:secreted trypsin-like serine protease